MLGRESVSEALWCIVRVRTACVGRLVLEPVGVSDRVFVGGLGQLGASVWLQRRLVCTFGFGARRVVRRLGARVLELSVGESERNVRLCSLGVCALVSISLWLAFFVSAPGVQASKSRLSVESRAAAGGC